MNCLGLRILRNESDKWYTTRKNEHVVSEQVAVEPGAVACFLFFGIADIKS